MCVPAFSTSSGAIYCGDNVAVLRRCIPHRSVDLIYADPPFNSGHAYYATGKRCEGPRFHDVWHWDNVAYRRALAESPTALAAALEALRGILGESGALAYCAALAVCLGELRRVLKDTGSLYLHCDVRMSHYLRLMLDALFGRERCRNEIVWAYRTGGAGKRHFARKHDVILFYTASDEYTFHPQRERVRYRKRFFGAQRDAHGYYADVLLRDVWEIPAVLNLSSERTGYPTQKPLALLERIIAASSNVGDVVLDPYCGSGTALVAAQKLGRRWIGVDASADAVRVAQARLSEAQIER
ncbi:MAG: site-specific DNA-methyltransferase [Thermoflexales bacterium]|nr:site-specific DNA-methyltransferase [Thermoflexales bacterium]MDW8350385.1 site-specific DNA-methyltransferase [Anaerolineae bacterium]